MLKMDEAKIKALTDFKRLGKIPQGLSRQEKFIFLRRAKSFVFESK